MSVAVEAGIVETVQEIGQDIWLLLCLLWHDCCAISWQFIATNSLKLFNTAASTWQWMEEWADGVADLIRLYARLTINYLLEYYKKAEALEICGIVLVIVFLVLHIGRWIMRRTKTSFGPIDPPSIFDLAKTSYEPGHCSQVIELVEKYDYDINFQIPSGLNIFLCACLSGERKLVKYMLKKGAIVSRCTEEGDGALYLATFGLLSWKWSRTPHLGVIEDLIKAGCDVNAQNASGYTALHRAASRGHVPLISLLLGHGADPHICNQVGIYPVDSATRGGHVQAAELLVIERREQMTEPHPLSCRGGASYKPSSVQNLPASSHKCKLKARADAHPYKTQADSSSFNKAKGDSTQGDSSSYKTQVDSSYNAQGDSPYTAVQGESSERFLPKNAKGEGPHTPHVMHHVIESPLPKRPRSLREGLHLDTK